MRWLILLMAMTTGAVAAPEIDQQRNRATALFLVAAKQCAAHREDNEIFAIAVQFARAEFAAAGVPNGDIETLINSVRDNPDGGANPVACALYDSAINNLKKP